MDGPVDNLDAAHRTDTGGAVVGGLDVDCYKILKCNALNFS